MSFEPVREKGISFSLWEILPQGEKSGSRQVEKESRGVSVLSGGVRSSRYCPAAGAVLLIASLITLVIFNLPLPPRAYLKQGPPCAQPGLD